VTGSRTRKRTPTCSTWLGARKVWHGLAAIQRVLDERGACYVRDELQTAFGNDVDGAPRVVPKNISPAAVALVEAALDGLPDAHESGASDLAVNDVAAQTASPAAPKTAVLSPPLLPSTETLPENVVRYAAANTNICRIE
jgi:hypothetical protein